MDSSTETNIKANGALGSAVLPVLVEAGFEVIALVRTPGKITNLPSNAHEVVVDFDSPDALASALKGQDAVVSTLNAQGAQAEIALITASSLPDSTVRRFIPSGFGPDMERPKERALPIYVGKVGIENRLRALAGGDEEGGGNRLSWTTVSNGAFLDWGLEHNFLLDAGQGKATLWDGGEHKFGMTSLAAIGQAVVGVLRNPEETKNRTVYVREAAVSMKQLVSIVQDLNPGKKWTIEEASTFDAAKKSGEAMTKGNNDFSAIAGFIFRVTFGKDAGADVAVNDNQLLGVHELNERELKEVVKNVLANVPGAL
ncbi:NAD(P)-binding protein [Cryphonectria parasitica EP155]|uniref:NAD(P)-binding protein n=1 Tax=Cryphonectria parasitica (strain ATCC 38755 / EP155) TaxID=660469 RepID=A0A9P5CQY5_CRYP1|nr:NAD(P)-binding protein [Cryphonectria parasitica EP155]KAF3766967.1 NAD(P)-binding protein [Cryphonectria parasitica EP155]